MKNFVFMNYYYYIRFLRGGHTHTRPENIAHIIYPKVINLIIKKRKKEFMARPCSIWKNVTALPVHYTRRHSSLQEMHSLHVYPAHYFPPFFFGKFCYQSKRFFFFAFIKLLKIFFV